jgi:hypothetical protein
MTDDRGRNAAGALATSHKGEACLAWPERSEGNSEVGDRKRKRKRIHRQGAKVAKGRGGEELKVISYSLMGKRREREILKNSEGL